MKRLKKICAAALSLCLLITAAYPVLAAEENYIRPEDIARLIAFRDDPSDESWIGGGR